MKTAVDCRIVCILVYSLLLHRSPRQGWYLPPTFSSTIHIRMVHILSATEIPLFLFLFNQIFPSDAGCTLCFALMSRVECSILFIFLATYSEQRVGVLGRRMLLPLYPQTAAAEISDRRRPTFASIQTRVNPTVVHTSASVQNSHHIASSQFSSLYLSLKCANTRKSIM